MGDVNIALQLPYPAIAISFSDSSYFVGIAFKDIGGCPLGQRGQWPPQSGSNLQIRNGILVLIMFIFQVYTVVVWWIRVITYSLISGKVKELTTQVWNIQNNVTLTFLSTLEYVSAVVN